MLVLTRTRAEALIEEARRHRRRRWLANGALIAATALVVTVAVIAVRLATSGHAARGRHRPAGWISAAAASMPPEIVVVTGASGIEVVSSRTLRVIRTLAANAAMFSGPETLAASRSGLVFFDRAAHHSEQVLSVPLAGGPVRAIAYGRTPAISPDGRFLAYVAENKGSAVRGVGPTGIVVRDLASGGQRTWAIPVADAYIPAMTWSPDGRHLAVTTDGGTDLSPITLVLDTRPHGRTLSAAIQPDPAGRYFLITGTGPFEKMPGATALGADSEVFLWTPGMRGPVPILHRFTLAIWA